MTCLISPISPDFIDSVRACNKKNMSVLMVSINIIYFVGRQTSGPNCLHQKQVFVPGQLDKLLGLLDIHTERLLTEDRLTSLQIHAGQVQVSWVDGSDINNLVNK